MRKTILITGAGSFIAGHLKPILPRNFTLKFLTRTPRGPDEYAWDLEKRTLDENALDDVSAIVHLSGAKLNDGKPLTPQRQKLIRDTRIGASDHRPQPPHHDRG